MRPAKLAALTLALLVLTPSAVALMPTPATQEARLIDDLFRVINVIAIVIGVAVGIVMVYLLVRFHRNKDVPRGETHRGHTKAEIAWTIAPVVILVFIAYQSVVVMEAVERPSAAALAAEDALEIEVVGHQFTWEFRYPEGRPQFNELRVEEGRLVLLRLTGADVIHAFNVPELGLMVDTIPERTTTLWFRAPAYRATTDANTDYLPKADPNEYFVQCREYCGAGHAYMHAKLVVFQAGTQPRPYGPADAAASVCDEPLDEGRQLVEVAIRESGGSGGAPWSIDPSTMTFPAGTKARFRATIDGSGVHNLDFQSPVDRRTPDFRPPAVECVDVDFPAAPQTVEYICSVPGHAGLGMRGTLTLT